MKKRILAMTLALCMLLSFVPFASAADFSDIAGHWARDSIISMADKSIVNGYPDGTFRPDATITRAEFLALIVRCYAADAAAGTARPSDVADTDWYAGTVRRALGAGLVPAAMIVGNRIEPNQAITREEAAAILALALDLPASTTSLTYADRAAISVWAVEAVAQCTENGLFGGYPDGGFHPQGTITRAEVAAVLTRAGTSPSTPAQPLVLDISGTDGLVVAAASDLTITTNASVVRVQVRDSYGNVIGEKAGNAASSWTVSVRPVRAGQQFFTIHASVVTGGTLSDTPALTVPVTVSAAAGDPAVIAAKVTSTTPLSGSIVTVNVTTNTAATRVALYDASGVCVAETAAYTESGANRYWALDYTVPAGAATRVLTVCAGNAEEYNIDADSTAKLTLTVKDSAKLPAVISVKANDDTPTVGDTVTITVTTNVHTSRVKLVNALGGTISEKTSGYASSGSTRVWKFTMKTSAAGVSQVRAYAGSSGGYAENAYGSVTLTIAEKTTAARSAAASTTTPAVGEKVTITVTTDTAVRRVKLTDASGYTLSTTTTYRTSGSSRIWTLTYTPKTTGQKQLRVYYGSSATGSYGSDYTTLTLNVSDASSGLTVDDITPSTASPTVGQSMVVYVTTGRGVTRLKIVDIHGSTVATVSSGYVDSIEGRVWTVSMTPTRSGIQQYYVYPGNASGYLSTATAFALSVQGQSTTLPSASAPSVSSVGVDKTYITVGDVLTVTVYTNASADSVRLIDSNGTVISSTDSYRTSGTSRIWTMKIQIVKAGLVSGYVQASGSGYGYTDTIPYALSLNVRYSGSPAIYSVSQENGRLNGFGICTLIVTTNQNVGSVSLSNGVTADSYTDQGVLRIWELTWTPSPSESTSVTVYAQGNGTASFSFTWNR